MKNAIKVIDAIKNGGIAVVFDDEKRENEADLILAAEYADAEKVDFIISKARGLLCCAISKAIADQKGLTLMGTNKKDQHSTAFTISVDAVECRTGISPYERAVTARTIANPHSHYKDFSTPGHLFPLIAKEGLLLERPGHTEAAVSLVRWAGLNEAALICELVGKNGRMCTSIEAFEFAGENGLPYCTIKELKEYAFHHVSPVTKASSALLKTEYGEMEITVFKEGNGKEHVFLSKGDYKNGVVRIHSECFTGDVLHSLGCDCRDQLEEALQRIAKEGKGAVVYLRQEGRGIGLAAKIAAYHLQQTEGLDTVEANLRLGFADDEREYHIAAWILKEMGFTDKVQLLTGNPQKAKGLEEYGFEVEQVVPDDHCRKENQRYLKTKKIKMGHTIKGAL